MSFDCAQDLDVAATSALRFLIELHKPACPATYVVAHANTQDHARALIDAELGRDDANDDVTIVAVHTIQ